MKNKGARKIGKIYKRAGRLNLIKEQGAGKVQKLEGNVENYKKGELGHHKKIKGSGKISK